jgi:hypothetical protein
MKPISCVLVAGLWASVVGAAPPLGTVLVLDNGQVIEGQIERVGERYRVVKDGGETWLPAAHVQAVCADLTAAYQSLSHRIEATDTEGHLRLARWCESVGLREQALTEAKAALKIKPTHAAAQRFWQHLQEPPVVQAVATAPAPPPSPPPEPTPVEVGAEGLKRFTAQIQPLLMNACVKCHAAPMATTFKLQRVYPGDLNHRTATYWNLSSAAAHVDPANPQTSKLLGFAGTGHGGDALPPIRNKVPLKILEDWVSLVASERRPQTPASPKPPPAVTTAEAKVETKPEKTAGPADPFDPAIFNRQHHASPPVSHDADPKRP